MQPQGIRKVLTEGGTEGAILHLYELLQELLHDFGYLQTKVDTIKPGDEKPPQDKPPPLAPVPSYQPYEPGKEGA